MFFIVVLWKNVVNDKQTCDGRSPHQDQRDKKSSVIINFLRIITG